MNDKATAPDGSPAAPPEQLIETDANGDPVRQGSLMDERQSYERAIEGLKIAADRAAHLVRSEPENASQWRVLASNLDQVRRACVQHAGLGLAMKERETADVRGEAMRWKFARQEFLDGLVQAGGGMRQLASCHRGDLWWSRCAEQVERLERNVRNPRRLLPGLGRKLVLPPGFSRH